MAKRYELTTTRWARIARLLPGEAGNLPNGRRATTDRSSTGRAGSCARARTGAICRSDTARGRAPASASPAGPRRAPGSGPSRRRSAIPAMSISCSTPPRSTPTVGGDRKRRNRSQAPGCSRGGLTTEACMLADSFGRPLRFPLTPDRTGDVTHDARSSRRPPNRPHHRRCRS